MSRNKNKFSFPSMLNYELNQNETFRRLFEAVGKVSDDLVQEQITQLSKLRDPRIVHRGDYIDTKYGRGIVTYVKSITEPEVIDEVHVDVPSVGSVVVNMRSIHDRGVLVNNARMLGFDYFSDTLTDDDYARIQQFVAEYWPISSGKNFVNFMGYINRIFLTMNVLWSEDIGDGEEKDYYPFLEEFDPKRHKPIWEGGNHFPTSHREIQYDALSVPQPREKVANIVSLFYYLAPIHLVLERVIGNIEAEVRYSYVAAPDIFQSNSGVLDLDKLILNG